jgi:hypothetical protein
MPEDVTATGTANLAIPIDLGSGRKGVVLLPPKTAAYFGITGTAAATDEMVTRRRKAHTRKNFDGLSNTVKTGQKASSAVDAAVWEAPKSAPKAGAGKSIQVVTQLKNAAGRPRYTTIKFPGNAVTGAISNWLFEKCTKNKPNHFKMPSGTMYPVVNAVRDVNPGETPAPAAAPAPAA